MLARGAGGKSAAVRPRLRGFESLGVAQPTFRRLQALKKTLDTPHGIIYKKNGKMLLLNVLT
jgi:hypothetical protein